MILKARSSHRRKVRIGSATHAMPTAAERAAGELSPSHTRTRVEVLFIMIHRCNKQNESVLDPSKRAQRRLKRLNRLGWHACTGPRPRPLLAAAHDTALCHYNGTF